MKSTRGRFILAGGPKRLMVATLWLAALALGPQAFGWSHSDDGVVNCLVVLPSGKILVAGEFTALGGQPHTNLARLNADGRVDSTFTLGSATGYPTSLGVKSVVVQPDGKVLVAGDFTRLAGEPRAGIGRLNADGTLDASFNPSLPGNSSYAYCLAVQPDGKILVAYWLPQQSLVVRLEADGSIDSHFKAVNAGISAYVSSLLVQGDGKIIVGGQFGNLGGQPRKNLARLNPDGALDNNFNPGCDGMVNCLLPQTENRIMVGGNFLTLAGYQVSSLGRLNADGTLDASFTNRLAGAVVCLGAQSDRRIIVGGSFWNWDGNNMKNIERLNADGTWDATFIPLGFQAVWSLAVEPDGSVLIDGDLNGADGKAHMYLQQVNLGEAATQDLIYDGSSITWLQRGVGPEVWHTVFEVSTNGNDWLSVGEGSRIAEGWQLAGVSLIPGQFFRARGWTSGNGSSWSLQPQTVIPGPVFVVSPADRADFTDTAAAFNVWVNAGAPCTYQWLKDGTQLAGATNSRLVLPSVQTADAGVYSVVVNNIYGSQASSLAALKVLPRPDIVVGDGRLRVVDGRIAFDMTGSTGQKVVIEASADLRQWAAIGTNVLGSAPLLFLESVPGKLPTRFYRLRATP